MRKLLFITIFVFVFFIIEFIIFNMIGRWAMPNLLILIVIFINLSFGIRYGLFTAVLAGAIKDSFSTSFFGINVFSFVVCAYMTIILKRYFYDKHSRSSRLLLVFSICLINVLMHFFLHSMFGVIDIVQAFQYILIPEIFTTLIVTAYTFRQLKKCVLRLFV